MAHRPLFAGAWARESPATALRKQPGGLHMSMLQQIASQQQQQRLSEGAGRVYMSLDTNKQVHCCGVLAPHPPLLTRSCSATLVRLGKSRPVPQAAHT